MVSARVVRRDGWGNGVGNSRSVRPRNRRYDRRAAGEYDARFPVGGETPAAGRDPRGRLGNRGDGIRRLEGPTGQTVGLTHDPDLVGNWEALRWGMLGLSIKGALWIGFAGAFLGIGLGGKRYRFIELFILMWALLGAYMLGIIELNSPFNPDKQFLPSIYFSADWYWKPGQAIKPRFECWGGMLFAFVTLLVYTGFYRKDRLALWMGLWGALGGALGFPLGQSLQAFHAWNPETFRQGLWTWLDPNMNWWNMMETTFGATMGAALGLGLWLHRRRIQAPEESGAKDLPPAAEWGLLAVHLALLVAVEFASIGFVDRIYDLGLMMGVIPIAALAGGRWWPSLMIFPITLIPIAGKTVKNLVYDSTAIQPVLGWLLYLALPLILSIGMAVWLMRRIDANGSAASVLRIALLFNAWMYFLLNYAFFRFPFPW